MLMLNFVESAIRNLFFFLDKRIYDLIATLYEFIHVLANQQLLDQAAIQKFANNIYALLAIFMLFRLAFVLLNAIIDPDKLTSKDKGFSKIMTRFITGLFLIVAIPWAFDYAFKLQSVILDKEIIEKIVFGADIAKADTPGQSLAKTTLQSFYHCKTPTPIENPNPKIDKNGNAIILYSCDLDESYEKAFPSVATTQRSWGSLTSKLNDKKDGDYKYDYSAGISTACGIVMLLMLLTFSFDVAVRVVKLAFLQLITPIAVVGYIEPGGKKFDEWLKVCTSTYLNLFVRLLAISFVGYIIGLVDPNNFTPVNAEGAPIDSFIMSSFVRIFIIIGCLMFAKEAPKMLMDMLGIKDSGMGSLNPFSKLKSVPLIGGAAAAGVGLGAGLAMRGVGGGVGALAGGLNSRFRGGSFGAGAIHGGGAAMKSIPLKGKLGDQGKGLLGSYRKSANAGATSAKGVETHTGLGGLMERAGASLNDAAGALETGGSDQKFLDAIARDGSIKELFSSPDVKTAFGDFIDKKAAKKTATDSLNNHKSEYERKQLEYNNASTNLSNSNSAFSQASTNLQNALGARNSSQTRAKGLEEAREAAWRNASAPGGAGEFDRDFTNARDAYNNYISSQDYTDNMSTYTAAESTYIAADTELRNSRSALVTLQGELQTAQDVVLTGQEGLRSAEKDFEKFETKFNTVLEQPGNKKDAAVYKSYKSAKNAGRVS